MPIKNYIDYIKDHWLLMLIIIAVPILIIKFFFMPSFNYKKAVALVEAGQYADAFKIFDGLGNYKDSFNQAEAIKASHSKELLKLISTGNIVSFGTYEQDNNVSNGPEAIEWLVLTRNGRRILLISKYILDCVEGIDREYPWENCDLRTWLNNKFLNEAFSVSEQLSIPSVQLIMDKNPEYDYTFERSIWGRKDPEIGSNTYDKVFILSISEFKQYFMFDSDAECKPTAYAASRKCSVDSDNGNCSWWLRTFSTSSSKASTVKSNGSINYDGHSSYDGIGIRPALWVEIN